MLIVQEPKSAAHARPVGEVLSDLEELARGAWPSQMPAIAGLMAELRADNHLLRNFVLENARRASWPTLTGAQSFTIHASEALFVRINLWFAKLPSARESYRRYLSIDELHNHDFDFFTTCLYGPGYTSTFWVDVGHRDDRKVGDQVNLADERMVSLHGPQTWFVEAGRDYHAQHWPENFSITLNVIPRRRACLTTTQYTLDVDHKVKAVISSEFDPVTAEAA
jgi:hypothetical protein